MPSSVSVVKYSVSTAFALYGTPFFRKYPGFSFVVTTFSEPCFGDAASLGVHRQIHHVALRRRHHAPAPIVGDERDPIAGEIDRRSGSWNRGRTGGLTAAALGVEWRERTHTTHENHENTKPR